MNIYCSFNHILLKKRDKIVQKDLFYILKSNKKKKKDVCYYSWCCCFDWVICCCLFDSHRLLIRNVVEAILYIMKISKQISFLVLSCIEISFLILYYYLVVDSENKKREVITTFLLSLSIDLCRVSSFILVYLTVLSCLFSLPW